MRSAEARPLQGRRPLGMNAFRLGQDACTAVAADAAGVFARVGSFAGLCYSARRLTRGSIPCPTVA